MTQQQAFEAAYLSLNGFHTKAELAREWITGHLSSEMFRAGYQAATEAAKATGTTGELPPLPEEIEVGGEGWGWEDFQSEKTFSVEHMLHYGAACAQAAFAEAARQPAPALPVKTWRERLREKFPETAHSNLFTVGHLEHAMEAEIAELRAALLQIQENSDDISAHLKAKNEMVSTLRAALAATAAPVAMPDLSDDTINYHLNQIMKALHTQVGYYDHKARNEAKDALRGAIIAATRSQP